MYVKKYSATRVSYYFVSAQVPMYTKQDHCYLVHSCDRCFIPGTQDGQCHSHPACDLCHYRYVTIISIPGTAAINIRVRRSRLGALRRACSAYPPISQPFSARNCRRGNHLLGNPPELICSLCSLTFLFSFCSSFYLLLSPITRT